MIVEENFPPSSNPSPHQSRRSFLGFIRNRERSFLIPNTSVRRRYVVAMIPLRYGVRAHAFRQPVILAPRRSPLPSLRFYSASLKPEEYHRVADETMDRLTSELEDLLEGNDVEGSDVEYSVCLLGL